MLAVDLLGHTLEEPTSCARESAFLTTVKKKLSGYAGDGIPEAIYSLRCGLVHEYRTKSEAAHVAISGEFVGEPRHERGVIIVSVPHFCEAVCTAFEGLFRTEDRRRRNAFVNRAFIHVMELAPHEDGAALRNVVEARIPPAHTGTPAASGTGGPFPLSDHNEEWPW